MWWWLGCHINGPSAPPDQAFLSWPFTSRTRARPDMEGQGRSSGRTAPSRPAVPSAQREDSAHVSTGTSRNRHSGRTGGPSGRKGRTANGCVLPRRPARCPRGRTAEAGHTARPHTTELNCRGGRSHGHKEDAGGAHWTARGPGGAPDAWRGDAPQAPLPGSCAPDAPPHLPGPHPPPPTCRLRPHLLAHPAGALHALSGLLNALHINTRQGRPVERTAEVTMPHGRQFRVLFCGVLFWEGVNHTCTHKMEPRIDVNSFPVSVSMSLFTEHLPAQVGVAGVVMEMLTERSRGSHTSPVPGCFPRTAVRNPTHRPVGASGPRQSTKRRRLRGLDGA